ncbi:MAG TPA: hypothetical protein VFG62_17075 [Rhodopila sp.]|jgi:hypothetical protein|nr:hypothetical protein [Rhodopila sp.]
MTYVLVRLYTGSSDRSVDDILKVVGQELAPQVIKGGCKRYSVVEFSDGRIGSSSFYEDRAAAERGSEIAAKWVSASGLMKGYKLVQTISGETVYTYQGDQSTPAKEGEIRLYQTSASRADVEAAFREEAQPILQSVKGLVRYTCFKLDDSRGYAVITGHTTRESSTELSKKAREARQKGATRLQRVLPKDPEIIKGTIVHSYI